ncbi:MAG TPA: DUF4118 domain-containing protein, partial [Verrucomicrobiae bacterium]|nr:DUF4118 domain-containing protein [Verrucomicrobiae bacterium]
MKAPDLERFYLSRLMEDRPSPQRYGFAIAAVLVAFVLRYSLDRFLGDRLPFAAFVIATTLVAWYAGFGPSVLAFVTGYLLSNCFFLPPRNFSSLASAANVSQNVSTIIVGATIILFGRSMHLARRRADAHARAAISHQKMLEEEVLERKRAEE